MATVICPACRECEPWVLCECNECKKQLYQRAGLAGFWCSACLEVQYARIQQAVRIAILTGHDVDENHNRRLAWETHCCVRAIWKYQDNYDPLVVKCSKDVLIPRIWKVKPEEWEKTKKKCARRFGWKQKGKP